MELKKDPKYSTAPKDATVRSIIKGDNLHVLESLMPEFVNQVKCVYIDPPYNNGENYVHYDDTKKDEWLEELKKRLRLLKMLLSEDGSIWISIDDSEVHHLKVAADNIFGRKNFITTIIWQQRTTRENRKLFSNNHEYLLVYSKDKASFSKSMNKLDGNEEQIARYKNPDNDKKGPWQSISLNVQAGHAVASQFYDIIGPSGKIHSPPKGRCWVYNESKMKALIKSGNVWFGKENNGVPRLKKYLYDTEIKLTPDTLWLGSDVGTSRDAKKHILELFPDKEVFETPKPELLIKRIFDIATNPGDLILDAYVGVGTSIAVAHKMHRQYIGIDIGDHIIDYVVERQKLVQIGKGKGILESELLNSQGFDFFFLGE